MRSVLKYQFPPLLWILATFVFASYPDLFLGIILPPGSEKIVHAGVYFVLCWLVRRAFYHQEAFAPLRSSPIVGAFIFSCVYGILDEFHQDFVPGRTPDIYNLLAAAGGALLYVAIASLVSQHKTAGGGGREG